VGVRIHTAVLRVRTPVVLIDIGLAWTCHVMSEYTHVICVSERYFNRNLRSWIE
jgi:hypothetical protein